METRIVVLDGTRYHDHGPATKRITIGTAGGRVYHTQSSVSGRPTCALCGSKARYSRPAGESYGYTDWRCHGCDIES